MKISPCLTAPIYFILDHKYIMNIKEGMVSVTYPVGDKAIMLIRQIRSFGSLCKELECRPLFQRTGKPKGSLRAPTYTIGGSDFTLHGRVGLYK
jgi:hypothetical protein